MLLLQRKREGTLQLTAVILTFFIYSFAKVLETMAHDTNSIRFWIHIEYVGITMIPFTQFNFFNVYIRLEKRIGRIVSSLLFTAGLFFLLLQFTYRYHELFYSDVLFFKLKGFSYYTVSPHLGFDLFSLYQVSSALLSIFYIIRKMKREKKTYRRKGKILLLVILIPFTSYLALQFSISDLRIDLTPYSLLFSTLLLLYLHATDSLFTLVPSDKTFLLNSLIDGILIFDKDSVLLNYNDKALDYLPSLGESHVGRNLEELSQLIPSIQALKYEYLRSNPETGIGTELEDAARTPRTLEVRYFTVDPEKYGQEIGALILRDVSHFHRLERELERSLRNIEEANRLKSMVIEVMSHDLRSPFIMLKNLRYLISAGIVERGSPMEDRGGADLDVLIDRADSLVTNLLALSPPSEVSSLSPLQPVSLEEMFQSLEYRISRYAKKRGVFFHLSQEDSLFVFSRQKLLQSVLWNVIENAIKYSYSDGMVHVEAYSVDHAIHITIENEGVSIPEDVLDVLKGDGWGVKSDGVDGESGPGIGLFASQRFIRWLDGAMQVVQRDGGGTRVSLRLPGAEKNREGASLPVSQGGFQSIL